jgi:hypothetical protein
MVFVVVASMIDPANSESRERFSRPKHYGKSDDALNPANHGLRAITSRLAPGGRRCLHAFMPFCLLP